jgi:ureidoglycolate lyase
MSSRILRFEPVTRDAFAPFGQLIEATGRATEANQGTAARFDFAAHLASLRAHARPNVAVFRAQPRALPMALLLLEKHPHSTQLFVPMTAPRYGVLVAATAPDGSPDLATLRAFVFAAHQAVNYAVGTWHHPMIALDAPSDFVMLAWEDGTPDDCIEHHLPEGIVLAG